MADRNDGGNDEQEIKKTPREARQGEKGPSMLLVLGIGLAALVIAYAVVGWINSDGDTASLSVVGEKTQNEPAAAPAGQPQ
ncbi:hypothetical protein [Breoghania sp. JC706]|uniref:hypothetical protein n=1 Tax=Breoghania sp. JC706 TaxID=3117732 RepID=UPI0030099D75